MGGGPDSKDDVDDENGQEEQSEDGKEPDLGRIDDSAEVAEHLQKGKCQSHKRIGYSFYPMEQPVLLPGLFLLGHRSEEFQ